MADAVVGKHACEGLTGELRALVGVEDLQLAVASHGIPQGLDADAAPIVIDSRHDSTRRLNQSSTTAE